MKTPAVLKLDVLATFVKVAELGSLKKASQHLEKPQPSVSRQIAELERTCGGHLFSRNGRGVVLTSLGERVLARSRAMLREADDILIESHDKNTGLHGEVTVGVIPSLSVEVSARLFARVHERHPGIRLSLFDAFSGALYGALDQDSVDIAVLLRGSVSLQDEETEFGTWDTHLVGPPGDPLLARDTIAFRELDGLPLVLPSAPSGARLQLDALARGMGIRLNVVAEANSSAITLRLIRERAGYSLSSATPPLSLMSVEVAAGRASAAKIVDPGINRTLVMRRAGVRGVAATEVARLVEEIIWELQREGAQAEP